ncbi:MAG: glycosyltransferase family 2 protein, partial [Halobacteriales archaeon]|nr:glycosyltransferase family 2 protein [Halobacteriales archaeon]
MPVTARNSSDHFGLEDVVVVMGTLNEAEAIGPVLSDIEHATDGRASVICVDGSTDGTASTARERGAAVIEQEPRGYGIALRAGLEAADRPVVVTTDCDGTYPLERIPDFLERVNAGIDVVSGDRLTDGAETMPWLNRAG